MNNNLPHWAKEVFSNESDDDSVDNPKTIEEITDKIVYNMGNNKSIIKLTAKELIRDAKVWTYNRDINEDKVTELKEQYILNLGNQDIMSPVWMPSLVYDKYSEPDKLIVIDGQHRREAIRTLLQEGKINENIEIMCIMYTIDNCETENIKIIVDLFNKINNNLHLEKKDYPEIFALEIINELKKDTELVPDKKAIKKAKTNKTAREPCMHEKEFSYLLKEHYHTYQHLSKEKLIENLRIINRKICWKDFEDIYNNNKDNIARYNKAKDYNFWLGLKSSAKYKPYVWIKYLATPELF